MERSSTHGFDQVQSEVRARGGRCRRPCTVSDVASDHRGGWGQLLLGLAGFAGSSAADARRAWSDPTQRQTLQTEWAALVRQRLEEGWRTARACHRRATQRRPPDERFVLLEGGSEQMHKNKFVVMDALFIARSLGRVLVEPRVRHSRLTSANRSAAGSLALHHYWDLQPICERLDLMPVRQFSRKGDRAALWRDVAHFWPKRGRAYAGGWRLHTVAAVRGAFRRAEGARLLVLHDAWRSVRPSTAPRVTPQGAPRDAARRSI
eukprot:5934197-Prymnesium_polylepis.1